MPNDNTTDDALWDGGDGIAAKAVAAFTLGIGSLLMGVLPTRLLPAEFAARDAFAAAWTNFGGGALLFAAFVRVQPDVRDFVAGVQDAGSLPGDPNVGRLVDLLVCAGFFAVYAVDTAARSLHGWCRRLRDRPAPPDDALQRSVSRRRKTKQSVPLASVVDSYDGASMPRANVFDESRVCEDAVDIGRRRGRLDSDDHSFCARFAVYAVSTHEMFEAVALGLDGRLWFQFAAASAHKLVVAFCLGLDLTWACGSPLVVALHMAAFACVTPLGVGVGTALAYNVADPALAYAAVAVLRALALGALLYAVFFAVFGRHKRTTFHFLAVAGGFGLMFALQELVYYYKPNVESFVNLDNYVSSDIHMHE